MDVLQYAYWVLMMPEPKGVILVQANKMAALACAEHMYDAVTATTNQSKGKKIIDDAKGGQTPMAKQKPAPAGAVSLSMSLLWRTHQRPSKSAGTSTLDMKSPS